MIAGLNPIPIKELRALASPKTWDFEVYLNELPSSRPIQGTISAELNDDFLVLQGRLATLLKLTCDRCLRAFNQGIECNPKELIRVGEASLPQRALSPKTPNLYSWVESLDPQGYFNPERWTFEQLTLGLPLLNTCGKECPGQDNYHEVTTVRANKEKANARTSIDPRMEILKKLL